jgi:hypothetical protein
MDFTYPIQAILVALSLLFAPADTQRIHISGVDFSGVLIRRDAAGWRLTGTKDHQSLAIDGTRLGGAARGEKEANELEAYVSKAAGHDWEKEPRLTLPDDVNADALVIDRNPDGFKLRNNRGTEGIYNYTVLYVRYDPAEGPTCNVLGAVKQPGVLALRDGDTLRSVLLRAGGPAGKVTPPIVWVLGGKPGEKLFKREGFDLVGMLEGRVANPTILDGETIHVEPTVLLELARDGSLEVDGQACSADELPVRLRDRVDAGVRSATLHAHRDTPNDRIQPLFDACIAAGIPSERLVFDSAAVPD